MKHGQLLHDPELPKRPTQIQNRMAFAGGQRHGAACSGQQAELGAVKGTDLRQKHKPTHAQPKVVQGYLGNDRYVYLP